MPRSLGVSLAALQVFCDVVEHRSFTRAAEANFLTQSAVSQRIRSLESALGKQLLERSKGQVGVIPTDAGRTLYDGAKALIAEAHELELRVKGLTDRIAGSVRVEAVYSVGLYTLPQRLKPFLARYPAVNVHVEYQQMRRIYQNVLSGATDIGIVACPAPKPGIEVLPFGEDEMVVICPPEHPLAKETTIPLSRLEGERFIAFEDDVPTRRITDEHLARLGVHVNIVAEFENIETIKNLVEIGGGVAIVPRNTVYRDLTSGSLAMVQLDERDRFTREAGILIQSHRRRRAALDALLAALTTPSSAGPTEFNGPNGATASAETIRVL
ncbi:MAG: LysR family transcriptional regulator [Chthonomonadales bacterium]